MGGKKGHEQISQKKISNRDQQEFERLFYAYFVRLAKYAYKYVSNVAVAQDLTQSVFLRIWELNGDWEPDGTIKSYLYRAVKNKCLNHIKHKKVVDDWKLKKRETASHAKIDMEWDKDKRTEILSHAIHDAVLKMPAKRREIFLLSRDEGLTYHEIAELKGITRKTVENHIGLALVFLKDELSEWI